MLMVVRLPLLVARERVSGAERRELAHQADQAEAGHQAGVVPPSPLASRTDAVPLQVAAELVPDDAASCASSSIPQQQAAPDLHHASAMPALKYGIRTA